MIRNWTEQAEFDKWLGEQGGQAGFHCRGHTQPACEEAGRWAEKTDLGSHVGNTHSRVAGLKLVVQAMGGTTHGECKGRMPISKEFARSK